MSHISADDLSGFAAALYEELSAASEEVRALADRFLHRLTSLDVRSVAPREFAAVLEQIRVVGAHRVPGSAAVRAFGVEGVAANYLLVVTDDIPFLVDSVTLTLADLGRGIDTVLHPQLVVERDATGGLTSVLSLDVNEARPIHALAESWMVIRLSKSLGSEDAAVASAVQHVLVDVRAANQDGAAIRAHAQQLIVELTTAPPTCVTAADAAETVALLEWLLDGYFTFLGYREYELAEGAVIRPIAATGLGILRMADSEVPVHTRELAQMSQHAQAKTTAQRLLIVNKSNTKSTVLRRAYLDHIGIKRFNDQGEVVGEFRFMGLFTSEAYVASVTDIPLIRSRVKAVMAALDVVPGSYSARDLQQFLETYPRDEFFQTHTAQLLEVAAAADQLRALRQTRLFVRHDDYGRYVSCLVYLPRDRYNTSVRNRIDAVLRKAFSGSSSEYTALVTESVLARIHYVVHIAGETDVSTVDVRAVERMVADATQTWDERWATELIADMGEDAARPIVEMFTGAFPEAYKEDFVSSDAVVDARTLHGLDDSELGLRWVDDATQPGSVQFKVSRLGEEMSLSRILPLLQHMGLEVLAERPYCVIRNGASPAWVLEFDMLFPDAAVPLRNSLPERASEAFRAAWNGQCEDDRFNALVLFAGITWQEAALLRAYSHYLKQIGSSFGQGYIQAVLAANVPIVRSLVELVHARLDPTFVGDRASTQADLVETIKHQLDAVASLDHDRILRSFLEVICATLRTNAFQPQLRARQALSFKLDARSIPDLPLPRPKYEVWVCSPRVEGVHLRFGDVARGGLRWSDRREDFRTEILGLVKAQEVKNAVIVPVGAKGGFVPANLPDPAVDRAAWMAEGQASYREYLSALLDITDNLVHGVVVAPQGIVRHDGDDPYLVVAADKGTATFSDLANSIAHEYGFWLDDAFASGGSIGYDHKVMGITAKGAWESVKRHFRELGLDTQSQEFTAVGIGDMSGDVFGNGMMLSPQLRLIAAFDHRDIFIDPNPDAAASYVERQRLFALPRSSWADYNTALISSGGGVFSRAAKTISVSPEVRAALGLAGDSDGLTPSELIGAILRARVDLLWNGGIGTYIKARTQSNAEVGDKANDAIRINGEELRCRVVGEGGNLGCTQLGRIEASRSGVRINTDAVDNSAGVDTSDHEVNIKILLHPLVAAGALDADARVALLMSMTDEVGRHVLVDNYTQNVILGVARSSAPNLVGVHRRMISELEAAHILDRGLEFLPSDLELAVREASHEGLFSPELCVLLAYAKIALVQALSDEGLADDPWYSVMLRRYFPRPLVAQYDTLLDQHPLRVQIINTVTCNGVLGLGGISFVFRAMEETGASAVDVVKAATVIIETYGLQAQWERINNLDNQIPAAQQDRLHLEFRRLLDRGTRWILQSGGGSIDVAGSIARLSPLVQPWLSRVPDMLQGVQKACSDLIRDSFIAGGAPAALASDVVSLLDGFALLDVANLVTATGEDAETLVPLYYAVSEHYQVDAMLTRISSLRRVDRWDTLARLALRSDLYAVAARLVEGIARSTDAAAPIATRIADWEARNAAGIARAKVTLGEIDALETPSLASMSVLLRVMRNLAAG